MTKHDLPILQDGDLRLRAPHLNDIPARLALGNDPDIQRMFGVAPEDCRPITPDRAERWVKGRISTPHLWLIEQDGDMIGDAYFHTIDKQDQRATLALGIISADHLGRGIGTRALRLLIAHGFDTMKLHRIALRVIGFNARAIAAYKKVGFTIEGREREAARVGKTWHDDIIMGLLSHEWKEARP